MTDPLDILVRDPARPNPAELTQTRMRAISMIRAVLKEDNTALWQLRPATISDGGYLATALAEVAVDLIKATGRDALVVLGELREATIRRQLTGGRS